MNNFKDYGFEADFEGKILSDIENYYIGYYIETYTYFKEKQKIPTFWNKNTGNCYKGAGVSNSKFSLKPIKKEWYENPDNFPCLVMYKEKEIKLMEYYVESSKHIEAPCLLTSDGLVYHSLSECRLATEEEALKLVKKV